MKTGNKNFADKFSLIFKKFIFKLPVLVWAVFALIGIWFIGLIFGYYIGSEPSFSPTPLIRLQTQNERLNKLVKAYEDIENLYYLQNQDLGVIMDVNILENHPNEFYDAVKSIRQRRDTINIQYGRILELRKDAGLPETTDTKIN